jgi:hypothetical protein
MLRLRADQIRNRLRLASRGIHWLLDGSNPNHFLSSEANSKPQNPLVGRLLYLIQNEMRTTSGELLEKSSKMRTEYPALINSMHVCEPTYPAPARHHNSHSLVANFSRTQSTQSRLSKTPYHTNTMPKIANSDESPAAVGTPHFRLYCAWLASLPPNRANWFPQQKSIQIFSQKALFLDRTSPEPSRTDLELSRRTRWRIKASGSDL